jgi:hypothetical protein
MRFSTVFVRFAPLVFVAAIAACSASSPINAVPEQSAAAGPAAKQGYIPPEKMLELQIAGKIPSAFKRSVLKHILAEAREHRKPDVRVDTRGIVGMWVANGYFGYIFGQNKKGDHTIAAINTNKNGCYYNYGLKVDHDRNLWTSCYNSSAASGGGVQEYAHGSSAPAGTYFDYFSCGGSCEFYGFANDVAVDTSGHVFASNIVAELCKASGCSYSADPVTWWKASSPSSTGTGIVDTDLQNAYYLDVDASGNLYVDGYGCVKGDGGCGYLLDEIDDPTGSSPTIKTLIKPNNAVILQGVYVSKGGTLNVVEPNDRKIAQYALPFKTGEQAKMLGPTVTDQAGYGMPADGGFNVNDTAMVLGDAWGWVDVGRMPNHWNATIGININQDNLAAQYVPSDK